jgi:hypothetical protein
MIERNGPRFSAAKPLFCSDRAGFWTQVQVTLPIAAHRYFDASAPQATILRGAPATDELWLIRIAR